MPLTDTDYEYSAWLASAGLPSVKLQQLMHFFHNPVECYHAFIKNEKFFSDNVPPRYIDILKRNAVPARIDKYKKLMDIHGIHTLYIDNEVYPYQLKNISDPPVILFYQGSLSCLSRKMIAVVGSRAASYSGQKATQKIARDLSKHGVTIVSGLASGIDTSAHTGCLEGESPTIAVTACGLDIVYPSVNTKLRDMIIKKGGLLLSEYPPEEKPSGWHFPVRNRIITGLAQALILMEAKIRSGSMTSVHHALDQGKDVFVYPGDPISEYFEGNHQLLREGGIFFTSAENILEDLHWLDNPSSVMQNSDCSTVNPALTAEEYAVINALKQGTLGFEKMMLISGLDPSRLMSTLTMLQIKGLIEAMPGKQYQLKK